MVFILIKCNIYGAKVRYYDDILSLHTRNVNPLLQKYEPMKKINLYGVCKILVINML